MFGLLTSNKPSDNKAAKEPRIRTLQKPRSDMKKMKISKQTPKKSSLQPKRTKKHKCANDASKTVPEKKRKSSDDSNSSISKQVSTATRLNICQEKDGNKYKIIEENLFASVFDRITCEEDKTNEIEPGTTEINNNRTDQGRIEDDANDSDSSYIKENKNCLQKIDIQEIYKNDEDRTNKFMIKDENIYAKESGSRYHATNLNGNEILSNFDMDDQIEAILLSDEIAHNLEKELFHEVRNVLESDIVKINEEINAVSKSISKLRDGPLCEYGWLAESAPQSKDVFQNAIEFFEILKEQLKRYRKFKAELKTKRLTKTFQLHEVDEKISNYERDKGNKKTESLSIGWW